ncbi:galactose-1-phosphate uridylyltransferase [Paenibacillus sp. J31TS4]|uniref:UDP-glucose--hexose-1-phosphate uridylyltransferase n=1 Tax=Paenibacillus sp. J31TS4 TaxID=2807195 RepID=UPI001B0CECE9|nr:UDP-glucose--hexose-1-phosphate uridylyltransferase [Paenibacillus sp. J31TS4]GIP37997.1 galactose-1-phosphate uridylyltransferase [Paenibacillus sp. J31TS4]
MTQADSRKEIARLVAFGERKGLLEAADRHLATNALLDALRIEEPWQGEWSGEELRELDAMDSPVPILDRLLDDAADRGVLPDRSVTQRDLLDARLMGLLMPRPSETIRRFEELAREASVQEATDWFYRLAIETNYIRMDRIAKNAYWQAKTPYGELEITINLSKPEKDPKTIAAERSMPQGHYPKCLLCPENVGYAGRLNHPARQNLRVLPLELAGETWFFQYSPYVYYNEHCIVLNGRHVPMKLSEETFVRLFDVLDAFPHYFIGSNADLPIVGGSILSHDHFQGGRHTFAMDKAGEDAHFRHPAFPDVEAAIVRWPLSVIRLTGADRGELTRLAGKLLDGWRSHSDKAADILAFSRADDGTETPHNTITPIARRLEDGRYRLDLVLRNNRTTEEHPLGLFHPHAHLHHIKKENIGLIEVMGLAVLPGRLQQELEEIAGILSAAPSGEADWRREGHPLAAHADWIDELLGRYGGGRPLDEARQLVRDEVGSKYLEVLMDAGVFKRTQEGQEAFRRYLEEEGFQEIGDGA